MPPVQTPRLPHPTAVAILAAGQGTRMRSARPKVLHEVAGLSLLGHVLDTAAALAPERIAVVVGHGAEAVADAARSAVAGVSICVQAEQKGTGHAVLSARAALADHAGDLLVLYGDTPLLTPGTLARLAGERALGADLAVLGFRAVDPTGYGRLIEEDGRLARIVEEKDASEAERAVSACNSGVMVGDCATMLRLLGRCGTDNAQGEVYLTDVVGLAVEDGLETRAVFCPEGETLGVNTRAQLAAVEAQMQRRLRAEAMAGGATLASPETVHFSRDTRLGRDVTVEPNGVFGPGVTGADGATVRAFCHIERTVIGPGASVGPFARLRAGTEVGADAHVGNFVEMKATAFGEGAKAGHLSYLGDTEVGAAANIGAGTITCNYDGVDKHRTAIGRGAFIGTHASLVAPVTVADGAYVATGTVVTQDVPSDALAIARAPQTNRAGYAARVRRLFADRKAARAKTENQSERDQ